MVFPWQVWDCNIHELSTEERLSEVTIGYLKSYRTDPPKNPLPGPFLLITTFDGTTFWSYDLGRKCFCIMKGLRQRDEF